MTDLERIACAIWADRAARILAEDIAGKTEEGSAGKLTYDELGEKFRAGLMSEARAALDASGYAVLRAAIVEYLAADSIHICTSEEQKRLARASEELHAILNSENAP